MTEPDPRAPGGGGTAGDASKRGAAADAVEAGGAETDAAGATDATGPIASGSEPTETAVEGDPVEANTDLGPATTPGSGPKSAAGAVRGAVPAATPKGAVPAATPKSAPAPPPPGRRTPDPRARPAPPAAAPATPSEQAVHIDDRVSAIFVLATVAIFVLILLNGLL
ncbi:MAG: hypothetical protein M3067_05715, partial [Chloroflexota bacterium]|nr:hypothetical protein [Chloroflexota bacterium]